MRLVHHTCSTVGTACTKGNPENWFSSHIHLTKYILKIVLNLQVIKYFCYFFYLFFNFLMFM